EINGIKNTFNLFHDVEGRQVVRLGDYLTDQRATWIPTIREFAIALFRYFLLFVVLISAVYPIYGSLPSVITVRSVAENRRSEGRVKAIRYLGLIAVAIFALFTAAFYPGVMAIDSYVQYGQVIWSHYGDWHPPMMAAIWSVTNRIIQG